MRLALAVGAAGVATKEELFVVGVEGPRETERTPEDSGGE
jgi:hypothetical protein